MHPRARVRADLVARLAAPAVPPGGGAPVYPTECGARVHSGRIEPVRRPQLPMIKVYTLRDEIDTGYAGGDDGPERRRIDMAVEIIAGGPGADDAIDRIAWQVEQAFDSAAVAALGLDDLSLTDTVIEYVAEGEIEVVAAVLTYRIEHYIVPPPEPDIPAPQPWGAWAPDIGPPHVDDYQPIVPGGVPLPGG